MVKENPETDEENRIEQLAVSLHISINCIQFRNALNSVKRVSHLGQEKLLDLQSNSRSELYNNY